MMIMMTSTCPEVQNDKHGGALREDWWPKLEMGRPNVWGCIVLINGAVDGKEKRTWLS